MGEVANSIVLVDTTIGVNSSRGNVAVVVADDDVADVAGGNGETKGGELLLQLVVVVLAVELE